MLRKRVFNGDPNSESFNISFVFSVIHPLQTWINFSLSILFWIDFFLSISSIQLCTSKLVGNSEMRRSDIYKVISVIPLNEMLTLLSTEKHVRELEISDILLLEGSKILRDWHLTFTEISAIFAPNSVNKKILEREINEYECDKIHSRGFYMMVGLWDSLEQFVPIFNNFQMKALKNPLNKQCVHHSLLSSENVWRSTCDSTFWEKYLIKDGEWRFKSEKECDHTLDHPILMFDQFTISWKVSLLIPW